MRTTVVTRDCESTFQTWGQPPSPTERDKCDNAERAIRKAIRASDVLSQRNVDIFAQGSYRNRTNVRHDSDVDVCIRCTDTFFYDLQDNITPQQAGLSGAATYQFPQFRNEVDAALNVHFGAVNVSRGNKAFDVHENTYRVDADVVATFEYRLYYRRLNNITFLSGTKLHPDSGGEIINWPQQSYDNGVSKNYDTGRRFKAVVRILKRLRNEMADADIAAAKPVSSFLIECLVWNVPNGDFGNGTYKADVRSVLAHIFNETLSDERCGQWFEVNGVKYLFHISQSWNRQQAHAFVDAAWNYVGFG